MWKYFLFHLSLFLLSCSLLCKSKTFFSIFSTLSSNKFLHFFHTTLICHLILFISSLFSSKTLGNLSSSEFISYNEKVYAIFGDIAMLINMFSNELRLTSLIVFSLLYAVKSYSWILEIKAQKEPSKRMLTSSFLIQSFIIIFINRNINKLTFLSKLLCLEYFITFLNLIKIQTIILLDLNNVENNRTLFVFIVTIFYLVLKSISLLCFILLLSIKSRFPYGILKSLIMTVMKLYKKITLFYKYVKLLIDLKSIEEVDINEVCAICTEEITRGKKLQCSHSFHSSCLKMWCEREISCPICRAELVFKKEMVHETEDEVISGIPIEIEE